MSADRHRAVWDPGAQPERTYQAWTRTALALVVVSLLATRLSGQAGWAAVVVSVSGSLAAVVLTRDQKRRLHRNRVAVRPGPVLALTGFTVVLAVSCAVLVLVGR
ncbi:DUF202 domain-containing protein [Thalassiella azotivora]